MKRQIEDVKYGISKSLELPMDIIMDLPKLNLVGDGEATIQNHKGIIEYTKDVIRINTRIGMFKITGEDLEIKIILSEEITIIGLIKRIEIIG